MVERIREHQGYYKRANRSLNLQECKSNQEDQDDGNEGFNLEALSARFDFFCEIMDLDPNPETKGKPSLLGGGTNLVGGRFRRRFQGVPLG
jgi:hypothetical protein